MGRTKFNGMQTMDEREKIDPATASRSDVVQALVDIWKELLGIDRVEPGDSFFDLGGHSLLAVQLVSRIRSRFGGPVLLLEIFEYPRLEALADRLIHHAKAGEGRSEPIPDSLHVVADLDHVPTSLIADLLNNLDDLHRALGGGGLYIRSIETGSTAVAEAVFV